MLVKMNYYMTFLCFFLLVSNADAHKLGESYLFLSIDNQTIEGRVEITLSDLDNAIRLDKNNDGKISQEELDSEISLVKSYVSERIKLGTDQSPYRIRLTTHEIGKYNLGKYALIYFYVEDLEEIPQVLDVDYALLFDIDPNHRGLLVIENNSITGIADNERIVSLIFSPKHQRQKLELTSSSRTHAFLAFIGQGIWHIWIGIDHILFLMALVLPSVLTREGNHWEPVSNFRSALIRVVKIVSLFTIAHSITLSLAALGLIQLPSRLIESVIAVSVVLAALNNIYPIFADRGWLIIFGFGLFHGLGFATVLGHLGLRQSSLVLSLLGFNLGVEIGQIAIICIAFPVFYVLRLLKQFYSNVVLRFGSSVVALIALLWFIERAFKLNPIIGIF